ncbi:MAG: hypothetical protein FJX29_15075 [Alphaproteobacteria bacterium]|nr:hypothetical protein [Alphaproteobacteria bacterium]
MSFTQIALTYYAYEQTMMLTLCGLIVAALIGAIADRILGSASFGTFGNACLIGLAIVIAVLFDNRDLARVVPEDAMRAGLLAATLATGLLLTLASLRNWLSSQVR